MLFGQGYESIFGLDTTKWNITYIIPDAGFTETLNAYTDTLIGEFKYKKLYINNENQGYLREDTVSGKVWYLSWNEKEYLVMDMAKQKGDTFALISYYDTTYIKIDSVYEIGGRKTLLTNYELDSYYENEIFRFIEGVGPTNGFFLASHFWTFPSISYLLCAYKDSELKYQTNLFYGSCEINWVGLKSNNDNTGLIVYPNPTSSVVNFEFKYQSAKDYMLSIMDISGSVLISEEFIENVIRIDTRKFKTGLYIYQVFNENVIIKTGKIIINNCH
jgi:hypothetical protein